MALPLVSVIITTYNYAHTVGTAIDTALAQDYANLEVLVVDNASTDTTPQLVERYASDPRFRYVRNPANIGMVPNHNKGLREARGEYVLFLSADDFLMPGHVSRSHAFLVAHPEIDVLYTSTYFVNEHERFIGQRSMAGQPLAAYVGGRNELAGLLTEGCYMCFPTMLMRRDLYEQYGELDEAIKAADYEIVVRWAAAGVRFAYLPEPTCAVRLHSSQQSSPQNYVADAGDIREFLYLLDKFAKPNGAALAGYEQSISRHLWTRYEMARQAGVADADGVLRTALLEADRVLGEIVATNQAVPRRFRPTVIVTPAARIGDLERTLRSLVAQTHDDWEAIVLEYSGQSVATLGAYLDPRGRIKNARLIGMVVESAMINAALRIASGNCFVVVRGGNELPPAHLANVVDAFAASGAEALRTTAVLDIDPPGAIAGTPPVERRTDVYLPPSEGRLPFVVPFGPADALAFTRVALDRVLPFNERLAPLPEWEFYLRLSQGVPLAAIDSPVVVHATVGSGDLYSVLSGVPGLARAIYAAYGTTDTALLLERDAYVRNLESALARGPETLATAAGVGALLKVASGTELLASVR